MFSGLVMAITVLLTFILLNDRQESNKAETGQRLELEPFSSS